MIDAHALEDIQTLTETLFDPDDIVEIRCIKGRQIAKRWAQAASLSEMACELDELNRRGYNIYYGPNPRKDRGKSGDDNVLLARCLFCDFDNVEPGDGCGRFEFVYTDILLAELPEPTLAVYSGHGVHAYWRLSKPLQDLNIWRTMQSQLNKRLKADPSIKNPERIMRLPGFKNVKRQPYPDCFVCWIFNNGYR